MKNWELLVDYLKEQDVFKKYLYDSDYQVGVHQYPPIAIWHKEVECLMKTDKNVFNKLLEKVVKKFDFVKEAYFYRSDGSRPCALRFVFDTKIGNNVLMVSSLTK